MRTTLTLDDDVAALLKRLRKRRDVSFKQLINEVLRMGLDRLECARSERPRPYRTRPCDLGEPRLRNLDCLAEVLASVEGDRFK